MKKSEQIAVYESIPKEHRSKEVNEALTKLQTSRGIAFENANEVKGMNENFWYSVIDGKNVKVPKTKIRADKRKAEFVPYYRTIA